MRESKFPEFPHCVLYCYAGSKISSNHHPIILRKHAIPNLTKNWHSTVNAKKNFEVKVSHTTYTVVVWSLFLHVIESFFNEWPNASSEWVAILSKGIYSLLKISVVFNSVLGCSIPPSLKCFTKNRAYFIYNVVPYLCWKALNSHVP